MKILEFLEWKLLGLGRIKSISVEFWISLNQFKWFRTIFERKKWTGLDWFGFCTYISDVIFERVCSCSGTVCFRLREMTFFDLVMTLGLSFLLTSLECCFCSTTKWPSLLKLLKDTLPILSDYKRKNDYAHQNLILFDVLLVILRRRLPENQFRKRLENLFQTTVRIAKHTTRNDLNSYLKFSVPRSKLYSFFDAIFKMKLKDMCVINHIVINSN